MKIVRPETINDAALSSSNVAETDYTAYAAGTVYALSDRVRVVGVDSHLVYESLTSSVSGVATMTIASPCVVTLPAAAPVADTPIQFTTTGALPTGVVAGTIYYVRSPSGSTCQLAATPGGAAINTSGSQSGVHSVKASTNVGQTPASSPTHWLEVGATNRWKMFDGKVGVQTENADSIEVGLLIEGRIDSLILLNVSAAEVQVVMTDPVDGEVYNETFSMISDSGISDWWAYFFEPIVRKTELRVTNLPLYAGSTLEIFIRDTGATAKCGECIVGLSRELGETQYGARTGITDFSVKTQDDFGNYTILERAFAKRGEFELYVVPAFVDELTRLLQGLRATPAVYLGTEPFDSTILYGFYKDFSVIIEYHGYCVCSIEIEGLT